MAACPVLTFDGDSILTASGDEVYAECVDLNLHNYAVVVESRSTALKMENREAVIDKEPRSTTLQEV